LEKRSFPTLKKGRRKQKNTAKKKGVPVTIMVAIGKPKGLPMRGGRTATNMMKKSGRGK
jgi:hypothetical protein